MRRSLALYSSIGGDSVLHLKSLIYIRIENAQCHKYVVIN